MENNNFLEAAKRRFPNCPVKGSGRWAIVELGTNTGKALGVVLVDDEHTARNGAHFYDKAICVDLTVDITAVFAKIPDRHYERERRD